MIEHINRLERCADILRLDAKAKGDYATQSRASEIIALIISIRRQHERDTAGHTTEERSFPATGDTTANKV